MGFFGKKTSDNHKPTCVVGFLGDKSLANWVNKSLVKIYWFGAFEAPPFDLIRRQVTGDGTGILPAHMILRCEGAVGVSHLVQPERG